MKKELSPVPAVGDDIYVPCAWYLSHGADDFHGGLAKVKKVIKEKCGKSTIHGIEIVERPGTCYFWENGIGWDQKELKKEYGKKRSHPDPDYAPDANRWD